MKKTYQKIFIITSIAFFILLLFHWKTNYVRDEIAKHNERMEQIITKIVHENILNNYPSLTIPRMNFDTLYVEEEKGDTIINISKIYGENLTEIEKLVTKYFCDFYEKQDSICMAESSNPFIIYPEFKDSQGNIIIQPKDLDNIKNYILFLEKEVENAIKNTKEELNNDIERLNLWTSIWIGILGLFGAIVPLFYSHKTQTETKEKFNEIKNDITKQENDLKQSHTDYKAEIKSEIEKVEVEINNASEQAKNASEQAKNASEQAKNASEAIKSIESTIKEQNVDVSTLRSALSDLNVSLNSKSIEIDRIEKSVKESSSSIEKASTYSRKALESSSAALKSSLELKSVVYLSNSLGNLKQLDFHKIQLYHAKMETYLANIFERIKNNISDYLKEDKQEFDSLYIELIKELIISTRQLRSYLNQRNQLFNLDALDVALNSLLGASKDTIAELSYDVDVKFNNLIDSLRK